MAIPKKMPSENKVTDTFKTGGNTVIVYCNMPNGLTFTMPGGKRMVINGYPVSKLVDGTGRPLRPGQYGKTYGIPADAWAWVEKTYSEAKYFSRENPLVFAAATEKEGDAKARDLMSTRHGREQIDVYSQDVATKPEGAEDD